MFKKLVIGMMTVTLFISIATMGFADASAVSPSNEEIGAGIEMKMPETAFLSKDNLSKDSLAISFKTKTDYPVTISLYRVEPVAAETKLAADVTAKDKKTIVDKAGKKIADPKDKKPETLDVLIYGPEDVNIKSDLKVYYQPLKGLKFGSYKLVFTRADKSKEVVKTFQFEVLPEVTKQLEIKNNVADPLSITINTNNASSTSNK